MIRVRVRVRVRVSFIFRKIGNEGVRHPNCEVAVLTCILFMRKWAWSVSLVRVRVRVRVSFIFRKIGSEGVLPPKCSAQRAQRIC